MKSRFFIICILMTMLSSCIFAQTQGRSSRGSKFGNRMIFGIRKKPNDSQKKLLQPNPEDLIKYAQFLEQPKTGIFRLFPDAGCNENIYIVRAEKKCLEAIPESSYYSFREREHTAEFLSDIRLKNNHLISDGVLAQGFFVMLGDIELEKVSLATEGLDFMQNFQVQAKSPEAVEQFTQMLKGMQSGKHLYAKIYRAAENMTYALRVTAFKGEIFQTFRGYRYDVLEGDKRIDLTVAFRIIRKTPDGSITLLWKELGRREAPKFQSVKRQKN